MSDLERWLPIAGTEYRYWVSSRGRVRSHVRRMKILTPSRNDCGYLKVNLGRAVTRYVSHLVAETFIGPRADGYVVDHIDFDLRNNRVENLRYLTHEENSARHMPEELAEWWGRQRHRAPRLIRSRDRKRSEAIAS